MPRSARPPALVVLVVATLASSCTPTELVPGPGYIHLETQPSNAETAWTFVLIVSDGSDSAVSNTVVAGDRVDIDLTALPGSYAMRMDGAACDGRFPVEGERVTDIVVRVTADGCSTVVTEIRDAEEMRNP